MQSHSSTIDNFSQYNLKEKNISVWLLLGYLFIIVYGSLLPFAQNALTFEEAWLKFPHIPLLNLGMASRADLVANLLLYIPLGFLACGFLVGRNRHPLALTAGIAASLSLSVTVAVCVEFTQQFFPPRTVSLNDLYAEIAGAMIGIALWVVIGMRSIRVVRTILHGGKPAHQAILLLYVLAYITLSFFPYDILLSFEELQRKLASDFLGWLFAPLCRSSCIWKLIPEALAMIPFAMLFFRSMRKVPLLLAIITGAVLGVLIEGLQLLIISGVSQGASIGSRAAGMMLGVVVIRLSPLIDWDQLRQYVRPVIILSVLPYLGLLALVNHWFSGNWLGLSEGVARLDQVRFIPFYYHYYTTEKTALISLLFQIGIYAPIGIGFWLWRWATRSTSLISSNIFMVALAAGLVACVIEAGKLFTPQTSPDPTDILIAIISATIVYRLLDLIFALEPRYQNKNLISDNGIRKTKQSIDKTYWLNPKEPPTLVTSQLKVDNVPPLLPSRRQPETSLQSTASVWKQKPWISAYGAGHPLRLWVIILGIIALCITLFAATASPIGMAWILPPVIIYVILLWWRPDFWLVWILAALPLLDLTHWSGRLYWTEFDTLLLATIGVGYIRICSRQLVQVKLDSAFARLLLTLFVLSVFISILVGIIPFGNLDHNAFASYYSSYNGLRAAKGFLFVVAFIPLLAHEWNEPARAAHRLTLGMTLGFTMEVLYVIWERITFSGLINFDTDYRITGTFHGMHTGGAYIEGYLVMALPFVVLWAWQRRCLMVTLTTIALYALGAYSVMVTFSRAGQAAFALVTVMLILGFLFFVMRGRMRFLSSLSAMVLIAGIALVVAWPIFTGKFSQSRFATVERDIATRTDHWSDTLNIIRTKNTLLFGSGLGTFPSAYFWHSTTSSRPSTYTFADEDGNTFLRLGSGESLYFEQIVAIEPRQQYKLRINLRSQMPEAALTVPLCEKALLYSFECSWSTIRLKTQPGKWAYHEIEMSTNSFNSVNKPFNRPVKLILYNGKPGTTVDIDNVSLIGADGNDLIRNGDFTDGMSHWFFSTDDHLSWHIKNLFLHVFFEQGWFGLFCFMILMGYVLVKLSKRVWQGDPLSTVLSTSLIAFITIGMVDSLIDEPRLAFLFYLLLMTGLLVDKTHTAVCMR